MSDAPVEYGTGRNPLNMEQVERRIIEAFRAYVRDGRDCEMRIGIRANGRIEYGRTYYCEEASVFFKRRKLDRLPDYVVKSE